MDINNICDNIREYFAYITTIDDMREAYYMLRKVIDETFDEEVFNLCEDIIKCREEKE